MNTGQQGSYNSCPSEKFCKVCVDI